MSYLTQFLKMILYWSKHLLLMVLFMAGMLFSCIEPYITATDEAVEMLSIDASLIKGQAGQTVFISQTTSVMELRLNPVKNCIVSVIDNLGDAFYYTEAEPGNYVASIPDEKLVPGRQYKLQVVTPEGYMYESDFETLYPAADVDTVYYEVTNVIDKISGEELTGIQFYIDLDAADSTSRYFRWKLAETFEYTSIKPVSYVLTGDTLAPIVELDNMYEYYRCWKTQKITRLFLSTTENLSVNEKKRIPLNFVSTLSDRLKIKYCLHVEQYTLSKGAYLYWQKKKNETQESGGLYSQQPGKPVSNFHRVGDEEETVLGYFWVSRKTGQNVFVPRNPKLQVTGDYCEAVEYDHRIHDDGPFPRYVYLDFVRNQALTGVDICFDCRLKGGSTIPPDFWE
jgi:hypothetical protein